jgi:hypothetical protein
MKILFNDFVQKSNAPRELKSAALAERWNGKTVTISFGTIKEIDCFGIGNTDATWIQINGVTYTLGTASDKSGLYSIASQSTQTVSISHNGTYIGRFACGKSRFLGVAPSREPKWKSTNENRRTLSGQILPGAGGYFYREIDVDVRYKIDSEIIADIQDAYQRQIGKKYPLFILFDCETHRIPFLRLYGSIDEDIVLQSGVNRMLYSKKFSFREEF